MTTRSFTVAVHVLVVVLIVDSPIMTNSVKNLTPGIQQLIKVSTDSDVKIDGDCVMAVAFHQQGIYFFYNLQMFDL